MQSLIDAFISQIKQGKAISVNTESSYKQDLKQFSVYLEEKALDYSGVSSLEAKEYLSYLKDQGKKDRSIARHLSVLRSFYRFLKKEGLVMDEPFRELDGPKNQLVPPEILSIEEIELLMNQPEGDSPPGVRDKAILELLYGTGLKVSELTALRLSHINLSLGYVTIPYKGNKVRTLPLGAQAQSALTAYLDTSRVKLTRDSSNDSVFLNSRGGTLTRQSCWKILRDYGTKAGFTKEITPHMLRHSLAVHLLTNGADMGFLKELLGLEELASAQLYLQLSKNKLKDTYFKAHPRA